MPPQTHITCSKSIENYREQHSRRLKIQNSVPKRVSSAFRRKSSGFVWHVAARCELMRARPGYILGYTMLDCWLCSNAVTTLFAISAIITRIKQQTPNEKAKNATSSFRQLHWPRSIRLGNGIPFPTHDNHRVKTVGSVGKCHSQ